MKTSNPPRVLALVRSLDKAKRVFEKQLKDCGENIEFIIGDVCSLPAVEGRVDYIIHGASQTASKAFVEKPVETIETAVFGTKNLLELAREKQSLSFVYLSSVILYGLLHIVSSYLLMIAMGDERRRHGLRSAERTSHVPDLASGCLMGIMGYIKPCENAEHSARSYILSCMNRNQLCTAPP